MPYQRYSGIKPTEEEAIQAFYNYPHSEEKRRNNEAARVLKQWYAEQAVVNNQARKMMNAYRAQQTKNKVRARRVSRKTRRSRR